MTLIECKACGKRLTTSKGMATYVKLGHFEPGNNKVFIYENGTMEYRRVKYVLFIMLQPVNINQVSLVMFMAANGSEQEMARRRSSTL